MFFMRTKSNLHEKPWYSLIVRRQREYRGIEPARSLLKPLRAAKVEVRDQKMKTKGNEARGDLGSA